MSPFHWLRSCSLRSRLSLPGTIALGLLLFAPYAAFAQKPAPPPPAPVSFTNQVMVLVDKLGCNSMECHGAASGTSGFKLSLFGAQPGEDYQALTKTAGGRYINRVEPAQSLLLLKATGKVPHQSPRPLDVNSPEYKSLLQWITQGANENVENQAQLVSVQAAPREQILHPGKTVLLTLTATFSDGSKRDVTRDASVQSSDKTVATVDAQKKIKAVAPGEAILLVSYLRKADTVRILVPQPLNAPFPKLQAANKIDELVYSKLKTLGIPPSGLCSDQEFLRRIYLSVIGLLPTPQEVGDFMADPDPAKRAKLIDRLLERPEFADFWALKWGDLLRIKSEYPVKLWPKASETYYRWVKESLAKNKPYDQFVTELLLSDGSDFTDGPANFYRALPSKDPQSIGENTALLFMGARLGCARCHGHPTESWTLDDDLGMAAFFSKVAYKSTLEWKEEIVIFNPKGALRDPRTDQVVKPKVLDGQPLDLAKDEDPRVPFAAWLTAPGNPWFSKAITNRIWFWLMSRGIVHEPDDLRPTNPPENPELLDYLANELVAHHYDLKHLYRLVLNSSTFQRSSTANPFNARDIAHFSHYPLKRLGAEPLSDAICQVTETSEKFQSGIPEPFTYLPPGHRATQLSDGNISTPFLELFGRPSRDTSYESERNLEPSLWQELFLLNADQIESKVTGSPRLKRLIAAGATDDAILAEFFLAALARQPLPEEKLKIDAYLAAHKVNRAQALGDILWALLNTKEFLFIR